jgi:plastocyanin
MSRPLQVLVHKCMAVRDIYLKIETISGYSPVEPDDHVSPPIQYRRDCMRNTGHEDGTVPDDEVAARQLTALIYREYLDPQYLLPKPDKLVAADINEPAFSRRVPGTVIYARPGDWLRIHVKNGDATPHSFHVHGLRYGIDSDGSWPLGTQSSDGRRSDEICPGQTWTYTFQVAEATVGAWPFHDHCRQIGEAVNCGLFGGLVVVGDGEEYKRLPRFAYPEGMLERVLEVLQRLLRRGRRDGGADDAAGDRGEAGHGEADDHSQHHDEGLEVGNMPMSAPVVMPDLMPMPMRPPAPTVEQPPAELAPYLAALDELAHAPQPHPHADDLLHVPLFLHQMSGFRDTPVFQSAPLNVGASYTSPPFTVAGSYSYICGIHGAAMAGGITVQPGGPSIASVTIVDFAFIPAAVTVGVGGQVTWTNSGSSQHTVVERGGDNVPSYCFNGRAFAGNTPTIVAQSGQRIRWYVFNLDLGVGWHNFHTHAQRWRFANQVIDVRSLGPAESFTVDTEAPPVLLLPPGFENCDKPASRCQALPAARRLPGALPRRDAHDGQSGRRAPIAPNRVPDRPAAAAARGDHRVATRPWRQRLPRRASRSVRQRGRRSVAATARPGPGDLHARGAAAQHQPDPVLGLRSTSRPNPAVGSGHRSIHAASEPATGTIGR